MRKVKQFFISWLWLKVLVIDWLLDLMIKILVVVHNSFKDLDTWLEIKFNELKQRAGEPDSGKV